MELIFPPIAQKFLDSCFPRIEKTLPDLDFKGDLIARDLIHQVLARETKDFTARRRSWLQGIKSGEKSRIKNARCFIFAPGPSLEQVMEHFLAASNKKVRDSFYMAVDGASRLFLRHDEAKLDAVITDLDGLDIDQVVRLHDRHGARVIVHGHGNNIDKLKELMETVDLDEKYIFTTQATPTDRVFNLGGFTDGDRAAFVAVALGFPDIFLLAMDLDVATVGAYSKVDYARLSDAERSIDRFPVKQKKMKIAMAILEWLVKNLPATCKMVTYQKQPPFKFIPNTNTLSTIP
nr:DUF115 domain-containing protein [Candidatus Sigynarchaeota archaeon]